MLKGDSAPIGYPIIFDILPDIDGFYKEWLEKPLPEEKEFKDMTNDIIKEWKQELD